MPRTFAYVRVSTAGQTTENQVREIEAAGFKVDARRVVAEIVSGSSAIDQRPGFRQLLNRLEPNDVLVVTKLDRLGRNAIDVATTVAKLADMGVRVHCLALGGVDLTSAAGRMTMQVINAVAQFERDLLIERTQSGIERAKAEGVVLGRPGALNDKQRAAVRAACQWEQRYPRLPRNTAQAGRRLCEPATPSRPNTLARSHQRNPGSE
jgi:putative DNA-invertase from lambdoid prophage Rac